jgi:hypothetical protein
MVHVGIGSGLLGALFTTFVVKVVKWRRWFSALAGSNKKNPEHPTRSKILWFLSQYVM